MQSRFRLNKLRESLSPKEYNIIVCAYALFLYVSYDIYMMKLNTRIPKELKKYFSREIAGQIPRLLIGGVKSFIGKIPVGNTGGANVHPLQPMEIPQDLKQILNQYQN